MYQPITYSLLKSKKACQNQLDLIETHCGKIKPIPLTTEIAIKFGGVFDIDWAATILLTNEDLEEFRKVRTTAWKEYEKVITPAWEEYNKVITPAREEYMKVKDTARAEFNKVKETAWEEYKKVIAPAREEYKKVTATAWEEYNKAKALTFIKLYTKNMK